MGSPQASLPPRPLVRGTLVGLAFGLGALLALSLLPPASSRQQTWPWAGLAAAFWTLPVLVAVVRLALGRPHARLGGLLDLGFGLLALSGLAATALSPLRATLAPQLLPFLGALALPYALLPLCAEPRRVDRLTAAFLYPLLFTTLVLWLLQWPGLDGPYPRNAQPFGHANTTGAVCALAAGCLAWLAVRASSTAARALHITGALLAAALAASSSSRGAVIALAVGCLVAAGVHLVRRGRVALFIGLAFAVVAAAVLSNARLREFVSSGGWSAVSSESNAQRIAMLRGGFALAAERPLLGWGPGAVPHVFPRVRASLPGQPDNYLQLHNSAAQSAATLGYAGLAAGLTLLAGLARRARALLRGTDPGRLPLLGLLAGLPVLLLFDHSFAVPAFAVLAALPVAALGTTLGRRQEAAEPRARRPLAWLLLLPLAALGWPVARDLAARSAWADALDAAARDEPAGYAASLRRAYNLAPADPFYADLLAAHLVTGHPFAGFEPSTPGETVPLLRATLARNPAHESAHYNLGWLLLDTEPATAREHFAAALRLAPGRRGGYLGLALARLAAPGADDPALAADAVYRARRALAAEILLDPGFAWSPRWREPALAPHRAAALRETADFLAERSLAPLFAAWLRNAGEPAEPSSAYRRVRQGHGVLYGHPDGPPPVDFPVFLDVELPPGIASVLPARGFVAPADLLDFAGLPPNSFPSP